MMNRQLVLWFLLTTFVVLSVNLHALDSKRIKMKNKQNEIEASKEDLKSEQTIILQKDDPDQKALKTYLNNLFQKVQDVSSINNLKPLSALIDRNLAFDYISKFVLGNYGRNLSNDDMEKFKELYKNFLVKSYAEKLELISDGKFEIQKISEDEHNPGMFFVIAQFIDKDKNTIDLILMILQKGNDFLLADIAVENISVIVNHRAEFASVIENGGFEDLLQKLKNAK